MNFKHRSTAAELMDDPSVSEEELQLALTDLAFVNRNLGGNTITINALEAMIASDKKKEEWTIVDVGCGDGEVLRQIANHFSDLPYTIHFLGIDINAKSIKQAREKSKNYQNVTFSTQNILRLKKDSFQCDVILCTLTMHHFCDDQIVLFLKKFQKLAVKGIIINDLQRSKIAYRLFQLFSGIFMKSKIAKFDGKVSIARSFKREDLETYSKELALTNYTIQWKWAFRYLWVIQII